MANIQGFIDKIKTAIYGREVRGSLADGLDAVNKETEKTSKKQGDLEATFDQLIINAGDSNAEIVASRHDSVTGETYDALPKRLDATSTVLADTTQQLIMANTQLDKKAVKNRKIPGKICTNINFTPGVVEKRNEIFDFWKSIGIEKVIITLHLNGPQCEPTEVMDNVKIFLDDAKTLFEVDTLKIHCTIEDLATNLVTQIDYQNSIYNVLNDIGTNFENVIILNERADVHNNPDNTTYCTNLIQAIQNREFNVGISFQGENEALECMQVYPTIFSSLDIIGINCYPSVSVEMQATSRNDSVYAWDMKLKSLSYIKSKYPEKKVVISETGILPFWEMLADPWMYDITGKTPASEQVVILFLFGLFENTFTSIVDETWFWFLDTPIVEEDVKKLYNFENFSSFLNSYL